MQPSLCITWKAAQPSFFLHSSAQREISDSREAVTSIWRCPSSMVSPSISDSQAIPDIGADRRMLEAVPTRQRRTSRRAGEDTDGTVMDPIMLVARDPFDRSCPRGSTANHRLMICCGGALEEFQFSERCPAVFIRRRAGRPRRLLKQREELNKEPAFSSAPHHRPQDRPRRGRARPGSPPRRAAAARRPAR